MSNTQWTPKQRTPEEKAAILAAHKLEHEKQRAIDEEMRRLRDAAPDLLEIAKRWADQSTGIMHMGCPVGQLLSDTLATIAKATNTSPPAS